MGEDAVKILPALADDGGKADYLRARADDDEKLEPPVVFEFHIRVIQLYAHCHSSSKKVSGWAGSKLSFAHMTVTSFSVSERFTMECV